MKKVVTREQLWNRTRRLRRTLRTSVLILHIGAGVYLVSAVAAGLLAGPWDHLADLAAEGPARYLVGPIVLDGAKTVLLLALAFPLGRLVRTRPRNLASGVVGVVYGLDALVSWVLGTFGVVWLEPGALVGRLALGALCALAFAGIASKAQASSRPEDGKPPKTS